MAIKPEDKPKLIALVTALLGVVAYVVIFLVPKLTATASPPRIDPPPLTAASATLPVTGASGSGEASAVLPDEDAAPVPSAPLRDSFTPPPASYHAAAPINPMATARPPQAGPPMQTRGQPLGAAQIVGLAPQAPAPPIELKGVILGDPAVAVISVNGEVVQRQVGEVIAGNLKLAKISDVGITVFDGKRWLPVTVGHLMASSPASGPTYASPQTAAIPISPSP